MLIYFKKMIFKKKKLFYLIITLISLIFVIFVSDKTFITDDYILLNFVIENSIKDFFSQNYFYINYYRPLSYLIFYLNYLIFGTKPFGFYLFNIAFHLISTMLFYNFLLLLKKELNLSAVNIYFASLIFLLYPQNLTNVFWISGRPEIVVFIFVLVSVILFVYFLEYQKRYYIIFSYLFFIPALLIKENAVLFPFYLILVFCIKDYYLRNIRNIIYLGLYLLIILLYIVFRLLILKSQIKFFALENLSDFNYLLKALLNQVFVFFTLFDTYDFYHSLKNTPIFTLLILSLNLFIVLTFFYYIIKLKLSKQFIIIFLGFLSFSLYLFLAYPFFRYLYFHTPFIIISFLLVFKKIKLKRIQNIFITFLLFLFITGNFNIYKTFTHIRNYSLLLLNSFKENKVRFCENDIYYLIPTISRVGHFAVYPDFNFLFYFSINQKLDGKYKNFYSFPFIEISIFDDLQNLIKYKSLDEKSFVISSVGTGLLTNKLKTSDINEEKNFDAILEVPERWRKDYSKKIKVIFKNVDCIDKIKVIYFDRGKLSINTLSNFLEK